MRDARITSARPAPWLATLLTTRLAPLLIPLLTTGLLLTPGRADAAGPTDTAARSATYADLAPLLQSRCTVCHSGAQAAAGLQLDSLDALKRGGSRGPVVRAGDPAGSELIRRLRGQSQPRMPLTGPPYLDKAEIQRFEAWIRAGLPAGDPAAPGQARPAPPVPVVRPAVPTWTDVAPIFATRCAKCHRDDGLMGAAPEGYRLNSYEAVLSSDDRVRVLPGRPEASELVRRIQGLARPRMPFDGPPYLSEAEIDLISDWIRHGARNSLGEPAPMPTGARLRLRGSQGRNGLLESLGYGGGSSGGGGHRRDRLPGPDDDFELRGWIGPDGSIEVERLRRR